MSQIKVSVIIPVYNTEKYLVKCLVSVLNQSLREIEIICINDCSTDNSDEIINKFQKQDSRIIYKKTTIIKAYQFLEILVLSVQEEGTYFF